MPRSRIPSPARSQGPPVTPRRYKTRTTRSVGSPARSTASGRLSNIVDQFIESNKDSFAVSPLSKTVLSDNTEIEMPRRRSWWKKVENSRDVIEVLEDEKPTDPVNVLEELDMEVLTQEKNDEEKKNYTIDLPESSDNESINSIVLPQRKLFIQKEYMNQKNFGDVVGTSEDNKTHIEDKTINECTKNLFGKTSQRTKPVFPSALLNVSLPESSDNESLNNIVLPQRKLFIQKENMPQKKFGDVVGTSKDNKTLIEDKAINVRTKNLFGKTSQRTKPVFPSVLLNISPDKTLGNKTKELPAEAKGQAKSLFGRPGTKRKNIFADFIVSESEDEIPEILPKQFNFPKPYVPSRRSSNASSITTDIDMDDWKLLPSSTMVEHQLEAQLITPGKKARLSKLSEAKESTNTDSTKQSNKSMSSKNKSKFLSPAKNQEVEKSVSDKQNSPTKNDLENTAFRKQIATLNKSTIIFDNSKNIPQAQDIPVTEESKDKSNVNKTYNINKTDQLSKSRIVENKLDGTPNVQQADIITQKHNVESEPTIEQQEEDEEIALTYDDNDPEDIEGNNDVAKNVVDDKTKTICVDNRLSEVRMIDNIEKELSRIVGAETNILQMETPMPNKSMQLVKKIVQETPDSKFEEHESRSNNTTKSFQNNQKDDAKKDNEQEVDVVTDKNQVGQTNAKDESNKEAAETINEVQTGAKDDYNQEAEEEELHNEQADENYDNNQQAQEELDEVLAETSQEIEELEVDEEEEVEQEQSQEMENSVEINESEEIEASHDDDIENNDEAEEDEKADDEQHNSQDEEAEVDEVEASDDEVQASENEVQNESLEIEEENQNESDDQNEEQNESDDQDEEQNESDDQDEEQNESDEQDEEQNESQIVEEDDDEQQNSQEMVDDEYHGGSQEIENEIVENDSQEMEIDNSEEVQKEADDETDQQEIEPQQSAEEIDGNVTQDTTGRNRKKRETNTPEAILYNASNEMESFTNKGRNTSIRKTKSILKSFTIRPSIAPPRESTGLSDGTKNSSAEGSGWDSHRTTRKTLRQTFGKDFTPRKSLRALVMEKSAARHRQTQAELELRLHQANSTELPNEQSEIMEFEEAVSDNEISKQTRQATLEMYLQKIKKKNMEFKEKIEQQVRNSLKSNPGRVDILNFRPNIPLIRRAKSRQTAPKVKRIKSSVINLENLPPELVEEMKYKPPKRFKPANAAWITKRLYKFLEDKLEPKYDYQARIRAEKLVEKLYNFVRDIRRVRVAPPHSVAELKREMARLNIVKTHFEFYNFFSDYLPREVMIKVIPDIVNGIPLPREGPFAAITV